MDSIYFYDLNYISYNYKYISISASPKGITGLTFKCDKNFDKKKYTLLETDIIKSAYNELEEYFLKERRTFEIPLDIIGTSFQKKVWQALLKCEYGKVLSYSELGLLAGFSKRYARAVGSAVRLNPIAIIIPCHRIISRSDVARGNVGNYFFGSSVKKELLALEGVSFE